MTVKRKVPDFFGDGKTEEEVPQAELEDAYLELERIKAVLPRMPYLPAAVGYGAKVTPSQAIDALAEFLTEDAERLRKEHEDFVSLQRDVAAFRRIVNGTA